MPSANNLIKRAMVKARVIYPGESVPSDKINQVFDELNDLIESWALEKLLVYADVTENFTLTADKSSYTYGSGGDFDSERPVELRDDCFVRLDDMDYEVDLVPLSTYRSVYSKSTGGTPRVMAYEPTYPLGVVHLWPSPSDSSMVLYVRASKTITSFPDLTTDVSLPPGYSRAIVSNLALEISSNFGKSASKELILSAAQSKESIKSANRSRGHLMTSDFSILMGTRVGRSINDGPFG